MVALGLLITFFIGALVSAGPPKPATTRAAATTHPADEEPWCSRVIHSPQQPKSNQPVKISASITSGHTDIALQYQIVEPGNYIELHDPQYAKNWTTLPIEPGPTSKGRTLRSSEAPPPDSLSHHRQRCPRQTAFVPHVPRHARHTDDARDG